MPQLRQNIATREWVIVATERAKRPEDFTQTDKEKNKQELPEYSTQCPFCPGNEKTSPIENFSIRNDKNWKVRVIPNKFPALVAEGKREFKNEGIVRHMDGFGIHEVIIETPLHNATIALMENTQVENIIKTYRNRYMFAVNDERIELVTIFKNHGPSAGASQEHSHSQMIASPVVPAHIRSRIEDAMRYYDDNMECVFCKMIKDEINAGERIVAQTENFAAFIPYAAFSPFHIWLLPKKHNPCFQHISDEEIKEFSGILKEVLSKIYHSLNNPDFNYVVRSLPGKARHNDFFHWYLSIVPRVTKTAGFEIGSGMYINVALPEQSAKFLREYKEIHP